MILLHDHKQGHISDVISEAHHGTPYSQIIRQWPKVVSCGHAEAISRHASRVRPLPAHLVFRAIHNGPLTCRHIRSSISPKWSLTPRSGTNMLIHASSPCSTPVSRRNNEEVCVYCVANAGFHDVLPLSLRASFSHCHDGGDVSRRLEARSCLRWGTKNNPPRGFICII